MKKRLQMLILSTAALALAVSAQARVEVGQPAPAFTLTDTNGQAHSLADLAGKVVVLEWVNLGCPFVQKHYNSKNMQGLQAKYTAQGVVWLSICSSAEGEQGHASPAEWNTLLADKGYAGTAVLLDASGTVGRSYGARTTPHMFVINKDGTLVYDGAIDSIRSTDVDDIARAENYVAEAVDAVLAGQPVKRPTSSPYGCSVKYASK